MVRTPYHIHTSEALGRCPWKEFRTFTPYDLNPNPGHNRTGFIPALKHVGSVVRGEQLSAQITGSSGLIFLSG
jgi:hypothetical protein